MQVVANEQNTILSFKAGSVLSRDVILTLALAERANRDLILLGESFKWTG